MRFDIIASSQDAAGIQIYDQLRTRYGFSEAEGNTYVVGSGTDIKEIRLKMIDMETVSYDGADGLGADYLIFATRHQSSSGERTLSMHFPGNFGPAGMGGHPEMLACSAPLLLKEMFNTLNHLGKESGYSITLEATHHGPYLKTPCMFIEIGSGPLEWKDKNAASIIADTIMRSILSYKKTGRTALGFGGTHYCANFNRIELETDIALSHICPKYSAGRINDELLGRMISSSETRPDLAIIDWKGVSGPEKENLVRTIEKAGLAWRKTKDITSQPS